MTIDYRDLLVKYMATVGSTEGTYFIPWDECCEFLSAEDVAELRDLKRAADALPQREEYRRLLEGE